VLLAVIDGQPFADVIDPDVAEKPGNRPARAGQGLAYPRYPMREVFAPEIRSDPKCASASDDPADQLRSIRSDNARLALVFAVPERPRLLLQVGVKPVVGPRDPGRDDLTVSILTGNPKGILRCKVDMFGIECVD